MSGGAFLARTLQAYGVDHVFFVDAILRHMLAHAEGLGISRVLAHSEKAAAYMADGYSRASRRPSICMAQSVGAANLAAGLQDAWFANSPVIAFTGRHAPDKQYRHAYQELAHEPLFSQVTKFSGRIESPFQLGHLVRHAFRVATSGRPGPVHLDVAGHTGDVAEYWETGESVVSEERYASVPAHRPRPDAGTLARLAGMLGNAQAPVIVVGIGACWSDAGDALVALARAHAIPVLCNLDAKALMADAPELDVGVTGTYGIDSANRLLAEADFALFVGCDLGDQTTSNWKLPLPGTGTAHVGVEVDELGLNLPGALAVCADPTVTLQELARELRPRVWDQWLRRARALGNEWWSEQAEASASDAVPIRPERLWTELGRWLPADAAVVADTGFASQWSAQLLRLHHGSQLFLRAAGSLGWAFPAALGVKAALAHRPVVCVTGDGGFMYHLPELETARRWGLHTITVVNNNGCLAQGQKNLRAAQIGGARLGDCFQFIQQDFSAIARSFGCVGIRVDRAADLPDALRQALSGDGPVVIDVHTDPNAMARVPWMPAGPEGPQRRAASGPPPAGVKESRGGPAFP